MSKAFLTIVLSIGVIFGSLLLLIFSACAIVADVPVVARIISFVLALLDIAAIVAAIRAIIKLNKPGPDNLSIK